MAIKYKGVPQRRSKVEAQNSRLYTDAGDNMRYMAYVAGSATMPSGATSVVIPGSADLQLSAASNIVITTTASGAAGSWHVEKTDPQRAYSHAAGGPVITGYGSFTVYASSAQTGDVTFDYIVSNAAVIATTLSATSAASGGAAFWRNVGEVPLEEPMYQKSVKTVGEINDGEVPVEEPLYYKSTQNL